MSSRALRKLQREQEQQKQLQQTQDISEDEVLEDKHPVKSTTLNTFEMLNQAADDASSEDIDEQEPGTAEDQSAPETQNEKGDSTLNSSKPKSKSKKKKKKAKKKVEQEMRSEHTPADKGRSEESTSLDEIDLALKALSTRPSVLEARPAVSSSYDTFPEMYRLFAVDSKNLNATNEMKRLFGNVVLEGDSDEPGQARRRGRPQHLDLGGALAGRNSPVSRGQGLAGLALRRNVFMAGKEEWPKATSGGLGMELTEKLNDGTTEYRFVHNTTYQDVQRQFETCVESLDPQRLIQLLQFNPYHISTLLQVSEIAKQQGDHSVSGDLLERALFSFGRAVHSSFVTALSEGKARLDFRRPENREFWLAAWRYVANLGQRGTWRTSYEWAKLVLSLDPEGDPYCIAINLDQLALQGGQAEHFLNLCKCPPLDQFLNRPNLRISNALAKHRLKDARGSRLQLQEAMAVYPYIFTRLFQELNLEHIPKSIWGKKPRTNREKFECEVYVHNAKDLWNTPEAISLLVEVAESVEPSLMAPLLDHDITLDEGRHILLSGTPSLIDLLPRTFTTMHTTSSDPLPPPDNLFSYVSATGIGVSQAQESSDEQQDPIAVPAAVDEGDVNEDLLQEMTGLQNFFSRFLPQYDSISDNRAVQRAAADSGESEDAVRQRGNRFLQLARRVMGMGLGSERTPQATAQQASEQPDASSTEPMAVREQDSDDEHSELPNVAPNSDNSPHQPGTSAEALPTPQEEPYDDERNQRWLAGRGMIRLRDFTARYGTEEEAWGNNTDEGVALVSEYASRVRRLRQQRTRDFIVNYPLRQGTSVEVRDLVQRYIERQRP